MFIFQTALSHLLKGEINEETNAGLHFVGSFSNKKGFPYAFSSSLSDLAWEQAASSEYFSSSHKVSWRDLNRSNAYGKIVINIKNQKSFKI